MFTCASTTICWFCFSSLFLPSSFIHPTSSSIIFPDVRHPHQQCSPLSNHLMDGISSLLSTALSKASPSLSSSSVVVFDSDCICDRKKPIREGHHHSCCVISEYLQQYNGVRFQLFCRDSSPFIVSRPSYAPLHDESASHD